MGREKAEKEKVKRGGERFLLSLPAFDPFTSFSRNIAEKKMEAGAVVPHHFLARRRSKYRQVWCSLVQHRRLMRFGVGCGRKEGANDLSPPPEQKDSADPEFKSRYLNFFLRTGGVEKWK